MKHNQRDILTKRKQAHLTTGGDPQPPEIIPDSDVAAIAPHLFQTAPVIFTSNMTGNEINGKQYYKIFLQSRKCKYKKHNFLEFNIIYVIINMYIL